MELDFVCHSKRDTQSSVQLQHKMRIQSTQFVSVMSSVNSLHYLSTCIIYWWEYETQTDQKWE